MSLQTKTLKNVGTHSHTQNKRVNCVPVNCAQRWNSADSHRFSCGM